MLGFTDRKSNSFSLVMTKTDHPSLIVHHIPAVERFAVINVKRTFGAFLFRMQGVIPTGSR